MTEPSAAARPGVVVPPVSHQPGGEQLICRRCHRRTERRSADACTWWPPECVTGLGMGRRPRVCWDCCDQDERLDLVDAGCPGAAVKIQSWS